MHFKKRLFFSLVCFVLSATLLQADSQFRIDHPQNSRFILQGKPSATVGITAFMQEGLDYLKNQKAVYQVKENVTWREFLFSNGIKYRPGIDRYALRSDRYYRFSHISISAVKPHQPDRGVNLKKYKKEGLGLGLGLLIIFTIIYFRPQKKHKSKTKKNRSRSITIRKKIVKKIKNKKKDKVKKLKKKIKTKSRVVRRASPTRTVSSVSSPKKYKSILIKPTAKRIKNIKLARQLALKSTENMSNQKSSKKDLSLEDFIQEDLANSPSAVLNPPTKTELRSQPGTEPPLN